MLSILLSMALMSQCPTCPTGNNLGAYTPQIYTEGGMFSSGGGHGFHPLKGIGRLLFGHHSSEEAIASSGCSSEAYVPTTTYVPVVEAGCSSTAYTTRSVYAMPTPQASCYIDAYGRMVCPPTSAPVTSFSNTPALKSEPKCPCKCDYCVHDKRMYMAGCTCSCPECTCLRKSNADSRIQETVPPASVERPPTARFADPNKGPQALQVTDFKIYVSEERRPIAYVAKIY